MTPRRADAQRNRDRLLAAAETALNSHGAGASLDDIAKAAGVGNATLYRHFPTRAALIEAVYDQQITALCALGAELARTREPGRALHEWLRALVAHITDSRVLAEAFMADHGDPGGADPPQIATWHAAIQDAAEPLLSAARSAGTIRADLDYMELMALTTAVARAADPARAERFLDLLFEGITPRLTGEATRRGSA